MARPAVLKVDIVADAKGVKKGVDEAEQKLGRLGKGASRAGAAVGAGLAVGVAAVGAFAASSVRAASDVEQSFGALDSVFGKSSEQVKGYANTAAQSLGLAKSEYAGLAAVVGSQLQSMGKSQAEAAVETDRLIGLGADLSATFGGSVSDAVSAVGSLLRGERDPIEKYGVAISAADVAARLAADGNDKLTGAALKTAQAQATLTLLTERTKNAHGAFGRESNTLAGQQQRLKAQFDNVKASVGQGLLPILTRLTTYVNTHVIPGAKSLAQFIGNNRTTFAILGTTIATVAAGLLAYNAYVRISTALTKAWTIATAALNAVMRLTPFGIAVTAITAIGAALAFAYTRSERFRDAIGALIAKIRSLASAVKNSVVGKALGVIFSAPLAPMGQSLTGGSPSWDGGGGLATAALGDAGTLSVLRRDSGSGGVSVTQNIDLSVHVDGALDGPAVAEQISRILSAQARRLGAVPAYGTA